MLRGFFIASSTACLVMALKTTRSTACFLSAFFCLSTSSTCQEMASPSRSGSVARMSLLAPLTARAISLRRFCALSSTSQIMRKLASGSTEPSLAGKSRTWPKEASTSYPGPRYLLIVLALAGDSTTTIFMKFHLVSGRSSPDFAGLSRPRCRREHGDTGRGCQIMPGQPPQYYPRQLCWHQSVKNGWQRFVSAGGYNHQVYLD